MLGDRIKELREDKNLKQDDLADLLGITRSAISSYETNTNTPSVEVLIKIADIFSVSLDYLTCRTKEMYNISLLDKNDRTLITDLVKLIDKHYKK